METKTTKQAFTLVEIMIAISIFALLAIMTTQIFSNVSRMSRKIEIQEYVFTEAEATMEKILREVQRSTIDYEEYYSKLILGSNTYGQNYGTYGATFYDPGTGGPLAIANGGDGICCAGNCALEYPDDCDEMDVESYDVNMGSNPSGAETSAEQIAENALCDTVDCDDIENAYQTELYLIDSTGSRKVFFAIEIKDNGEQAISMLEMTGYDENVDGIKDYWGCSEDYEDTCTDELNGYPIPEQSLDLTDGGTDDGDFKPITPDGLNIISLNFFIAPFEDPYRAFSEDLQAVQQHPHVIVVMTVAPSEEMTQGLLGDDWTLTIQGSASTAVFGVVPSEYKSRP